MTQIPNAQSQFQIVRAQLSPDRSMVVVTRQYIQSSSSFFSRHEKKKQITESVFYQLKYPNTRNIIKSESNHLVHFLTDKVVLVFDK